MNAEQDSRYLLDIFSRRFKLPLPSYDSSTSTTDLVGVRDGGKRSLYRTDAQLAILTDRGHAVGGMPVQVTDH